MSSIIRMYGHSVNTRSVATPSGVQSEISHRVTNYVNILLRVIDRFRLFATTRHQTVHKH